MSVSATFEFSESVKREIDRWLEKYPSDQKRSAVVAALFLAQEQNGGHLTDAAMNAVAAYLELPPIAVYEVATFYDLYEFKPVGQHTIRLCTNVACSLRGSDELVASLKDRLGIDLGETTPDGQFTLRESECLAACGGAPMCQINNKHYFEHLTPEKMNQLIDQLQAGEEPKSNG